jgi:wyosine [tRNA(Phe)-imidazoG37] synthetase (radical SAM superfamily)
VVPILDRRDRIVNCFSGSASESLYYITVLSNLVRGYDKYARIYDKSNILESTYPNRFFLLSKDEIGVGIAKASRLLHKTGLLGDQLIALETHAGAEELYPNQGSGRGRFVERSYITLDAVHLVDDCGNLTSIRLEEACARSLRLHIQTKAQYEQLTPRSLSVLPVARACQAHCPFCFSKASISAETESKQIDWRRISEVLHQSRARGASRAVITGGGEPSLLGDCDLDRLIREAAAVFPKVVFISNGFKWGHMTDQARATALHDLDDAGLSVLAISRHHFDSEHNSSLMNLPTRSEAIARTWSTTLPNLRRLKLRWICVLQRGGINDRNSLEQYLDWAVEGGVEEICFKELYVSTSVESEYYDRASNDWSADNQVPLRLVLELAQDAGWSLVEQLPWGAPIFKGDWRGRRVRVAAYTEPSLLWELTNGICRSWNLMADGRCLASLEDRKSEVLVNELCNLQTVS